MFLFLMSMLQLTATVTGQFTFVVVRDGDDVTLPCISVKAYKRKCDTTAWIFSDSRQTETVPLVISGKIEKSQISQAKSDRLSVAEKCSLLIEDVSVEDVGMYGCRQIKSGKQHGEDAYVHLSVVSTTKRTEMDTVTLNCSLSTYGHCRHTVKWLYEGKDVDEGNSLKTSQTDCSVSVTVWKFHYNYTSRDDSFKCEVTDDSTGKVQQFPIRPQSSGENTETATAKSTRTAENSTDTGSLRLIIVSVSLTTLIIIVVTVDIWSRTKGNKTLMNKNTVDNDEDEDEGSVKYENVGDSSASV